MPADLPGWLREEARKLRERGGPPRGGEAVAIITEHYARVAEEMLADEVAEDIAGLRARVAYLENELDEEKAAGAAIRAEMERRSAEFASRVDVLTQMLALRDGELASANAQRDHARAKALLDVGEAMSPTGEWPPEAIGEVIDAVRDMAHRERDSAPDTAVAGRSTHRDDCVDGWHVGRGPVAHEDVCPACGYRVGDDDWPAVAPAESVVAALPDPPPCCAKCGGPLGACATCGMPAQCGEAFCVEHGDRQP